MKIRRGTSSNIHRVACFVRIDVEVEGEPSADLYDEISDTIQDGMQDFLLERQSRLDLQFMTARILGPLSETDIRQTDDIHATMFEPLTEYLESQSDPD